MVCSPRFSQPFMGSARGVGADRASRSAAVRPGEQPHGERSPIDLERDGLVPPVCRREGDPVDPPRKKAARLADARCRAGSAPDESHDAPALLGLELARVRLVT